jgi:hypothetical protein
MVKEPILDSAGNWNDKTGPQTYRKVMVGQKNHVSVGQREGLKLDAQGTS